MKHCTTSPLTFMAVSTDLAAEIDDAGQSSLTILMLHGNRQYRVHTHLVIHVFRAVAPTSHPQNFESLLYA
jgi:hypothetical protein